MDYWGKASRITSDLDVPRTKAGRRQRGEDILKLNTDGVDPEVVEAIQAMGTAFTGPGAREEKKAVNARMWALKDEMTKKYRQECREIFWLDEIH